MGKKQTSMRVLAAISAVAVLVGCAASASARTGGLQRDLDAVRDFGVTGVQAEIVRGEHRETARSGVADIATAQPVPLDGYFRAGSVTKTFIATVVLQLVSEGRIGLDDTVGRWLPDLVAGKGNDGHRVTVRDLLQHTSGLHSYTDDLVMDTPDGYPASRFRHYTAPELVGMAMRKAPEFRPADRRWSYSNTNYVLAGMLIQRVTGRDWTAEVGDRILRPLGLNHTFAPGDVPFLPDPHAKGYSRFPNTTELVDTTVDNMSWASSAGELVSTTRDLGTFFRALQQGKLLRGAEFAEMHRTVPADAWQEIDPGSRYGLGLGWYPLPCGGGFWAHGGDTLGYMTRAAVTDDGTRSVVLSLSSELEGEPQKTQNTLARTVVEHALC
ncbi:serine hydrolase domain-containing protein [Amycolatopsis minnesotensis]|uniref:Serine hydrolase domain-containing protein n=1 Tax=Amycolatopsis minnesotensis TaxID=337894 RepID=A0ABN2S988_9PSEU